MTIDIIDYCCFSYHAMLISVDVHLLRGKKKPLKVEADALVETLKHCAQSALGTGRKEATEFFWRGPRRSQNHYRSELNFGSL